jgi:hypothetical protein
VDIVSFRLLSFIIFSHSLVNFIAEYQIECAIQFWDIIDRIDMLSDGCAATEAIEALIENVTILDVTTNICC